MGSLRDVVCWGLGYKRDGIYDFWDRRDMLIVIYMKEYAGA